MNNLQNEFAQTRETYVQRFDKGERATIENAFNIEISWLNSILYTDEKLKRCTDISKCKVLANVVSTGLTLSPAMKYCYVIPRGTEATLDISYMGLIKILTDAGSVGKVEARVVYENDLFENEYGLNPKFRHVPALKNRGPLVAAYAIAHVRGADPQIEVLTSDDIADIRSVAGARGTIWQKWESEMWRKSAVKRLWKYLPKTEMNDRLIAALSIEYRNDVTLSESATVDADILGEILNEDKPAIEAENKPKAQSDSIPKKIVRKPKIATQKAVDKPVQETVKPEPKTIQLKADEAKNGLMNMNEKGAQLTTGSLTSLLSELR